MPIDLNSSGLVHWKSQQHKPRLPAVLRVVGRVIGRVVGRVASAIAFQMVLVVAVFVVWVARSLWFPTAILAVFTGIVSCVFWWHGMVNDSISAAVFSVGLFAIMAGLQWVMRVDTWYNTER